MPVCGELLILWKTVIRHTQLRNLRRWRLAGGPFRRVLNADGKHQLPGLTSAIGDGRRPTGPYSPSKSLSIYE